MDDLDANLAVASCSDASKAGRLRSGGSSRRSSIPSLRDMWRLLQLRQVNLREHVLHFARDGIPLLCHDLLRNVPAHATSRSLQPHSTSRALSRLHALAGSLLHHSFPNVRVRQGREHVAWVGVVTAGANVIVTVVCVAAHVEAPSAEVGTAAQPWREGFSIEAATLQHEA